MPETHDTVHAARIAEELGIPERAVHRTLQLLDEGCTIPFIARYRKELTGSLDEVALERIRDGIEEARALDKRREAVLKSIEEQGKLTPELTARIAGARTVAALEDIYLPYRPKRRTRATVARERGLEPLAQTLLAQGEGDPAVAAAVYINPGKGVPTADDALAGARDIIAEMVAEDARARERIRALFLAKGVFRTAVIPGRETDGAKFKDYFDWREPVATAPSHRVLAMRRGEREKVLTLRVEAPEEEALRILEELFVTGTTAASLQVRQAVADGYRRLLAPSMETETRLETRKRADDEAIRVFRENLRQILMAPPLGGKQVLAIDPGYRTGCKIVVLDRHGSLLHHDVVHLVGEASARQAAETLCALVCRFSVEVIAVGNGTAGRETEQFVRGLPLDPPVPVVMVNESGASVYSASEVARREFPDHDVTVRGAVSIGRRLQDPLAELVKIDPKSIGVGQYQHDVDQTKLRTSLDDVVVSCVNQVGVDVNTASEQLLTYVSGLGPQLAHAIVAYRTVHGGFTDRRELLKVPRLKAKAFEQAAGFLRIIGGANPLDGSAVHPERYPVVEAMARDLGCSVADLLRDAGMRARIRLERYVTDTVGEPTLRDILQELAKPGRDPRRRFEVFSFAREVMSIDDVQPGMRLPGIVTNITAFGAFVDIGVHQDGLVHISQLSDRYVRDAAEVVKLHQQVMVTVLEVDRARKRIALSMKSVPDSRRPAVPEATAVRRPARLVPEGSMAGALRDVLRHMKR